MTLLPPPPASLPLTRQIGISDDPRIQAVQALRGELIRTYQAGLIYTGLLQHAIDEIVRNYDKPKVIGYWRFFLFVVKEWQSIRELLTAFLRDKEGLRCSQEARVSFWQKGPDEDPDNARWGIAVSPKIGSVC
ncbi:MAG: hypothetical protein A3E87_04325 [Gammaproteobacteria bacterium RIFCSPHIGHO2_12_FULL_35_23]|nr:MAG: hypothetical protein A3E87_04325 [Gammaproteobacteria bacterium RIFCSPHIGHO2_12_FULL_35_23]